MDREIPLSILKQEKRKRIFRYGAVVIVIVAIIIFVVSILETTISLKNITVATVDDGTIEITVNALGKVLPLNEEIIVSPINSRILEVYKNAGDQVEAGEPILKLELSSIETEYKQKLDEKEMMKSKLIQSQIVLDNKISELQMQIQVKGMKLKQMQTELNSEKYLDSIGASTSDKVRQAALNYEVSKLELEQLKQQIENQKKNVAAETTVQQLELSIFEKSLAESARLLKDARILSPQNATLTYINNQIGAQVSEGMQIAIVSNLSRYKVEAEIADGHAEKLGLGAKTMIKIGQLQLEGTVTNITPSVKNGVINFTVVLKDAGNSRLRSGLKTDVYVSYGIQDSALRIPNNTYYQGAGNYDLWVIIGDEAEKRKVRLGESSFEHVEVIHGLNAGDKVIISDMEQYKNKNTIKIK